MEEMLDLVGRYSAGQLRAIATSGVDTEDVGVRRRRLSRQTRSVEFVSNVPAACSARLCLAN